MVVDDDDGIRRLHTEILRQAGFNVHPLPSALEALGWLDQNVPAAAVIDLGMAGASGLQIISKIRGDEGLASIPVVVVTGVERDDPMWGDDEWGWDAYLTKPADHEELVKTVRGLLER